MNKVKVYKTWNGHLEVLYAVHENGYKEVCVREYSSSFLEKSNYWKPVDEVPKFVEYIGTYAHPKVGV